MTKQCSRCGTVKPLSMYRKDRTKRMGVDATCRQCRLDATVRGLPALSGKAVEALNHWRGAEPGHIFARAF